MVNYQIDEEKLRLLPLKEKEEIREDIKKAQMVVLSKKLKKDQWGDAFWFLTLSTIVIAVLIIIIIVIFAVIKWSFGVVF